MSAGPEAGGGLAIVHVFRAPVGGLFRHVCDLAEYQAARGHRVGVICDTLTGGDEAGRRLAAIAPQLALGIARLPMHRDPHPGDIVALPRIIRALAAMKPQVIHGHGSKGGLYARLARRFAAPAAMTAYTPHGGSLNYNPGTARHALYMWIESLLSRATDLLLFESRFISQRYAEMVRQPPCLQRIVLNGLHPREFTPRVLDSDATALLFIGELRAAKGIDVLLDALALLAERGAAPDLTIVGRGPDEAMLKARAEARGLTGRVQFTGSMPAASAFRRGRIMVVPSYFESMPYVVLEAAAASVPLIATPVGGIPEIVGADYEALVPPGDAGALSRRIAADLALAPEALAARAGALSRAIAPAFSVATMGEAVLDAYGAVLQGARL